MNTCDTIDFEIISKEDKMTLKEIRSNTEILNNFKAMRLPVSDSGYLITEPEIITQGMTEGFTDEQKSRVRLIIIRRVQFLEEKIERRTKLELKKISTEEMPIKELQDIESEIIKEATKHELKLAQHKRRARLLFTRELKEKAISEKVIELKQLSYISSKAERRAQIDVEISEDLSKRATAKATQAGLAVDRADAAALRALPKQESEISNIYAKRVQIAEITAEILEKKAQMAEEKLKRKIDIAKSTKLQSIRNEEIVAEVEIAAEMTLDELEEIKSEMPDEIKIREEQLLTVKEQIDRRTKIEEQNRLERLATIALEKQRIEANRQSLVLERKFRGMLIDKKDCIKAQRAALRAEKRALDAEKNKIKVGIHKFYN